MKNAKYERNGVKSPYILTSGLGDDPEIKGLDGERKALVYDNYSKLISATETIGKVSLFDLAVIGKPETHGTALELP